MANVSGPLRPARKPRKDLIGGVTSRTNSVTSADLTALPAAYVLRSATSTGTSLETDSASAVLFGVPSVSNAAAAPPPLPDAAAEDQRKLDEVLGLLERSKAATSKIVEVLEALDERVAEVEASILPVHRVTSRLRQTHTNVGASVLAMDFVLAYFQREAQLEREILSGPEGDLGNFLEMLAQTEDALAFFDKHSSYKSASATHKKLRQLLTVGHQQCEALYSAVLEQCSKPMDPGQFPSPLPRELQLLPARDAERLVLLAEVLSAQSNVASMYAEQRSKFLLGTLRRLPCAMRLGVKQRDQGATPGPTRIQLDAAAGPGASIASALEVAGVDDEMERKLFAEFTLVFLRMAEHERRMAMEVFGEANYVAVFSQVLEGAFDLFMQAAEMTIKLRPKNVLEVERIFYLLDTYDDLRGRLKDLNHVSKCEGTSYSDRLNTVVELFKSAAKQKLDAFLEHVKEDKVKVGADGNVHPLSSRTLNYLIKRLLPRRTCLEFLVDKWLDTNGLTVDTVVLTVCKELCANLEDKARQVEKKAATLSNIFLLNNYHYILHTVSNNEMLPADVLPTFAASYEQKIYREISKYRASWNQALEWLMDVNKAQLTTLDYKHIKAKYVGFNKAIERLFHTQKLFTIPNNNLRQELRELAKAAVVPLYRSFLQRYADVPFSKNRGKYERYSCETLEQMIDKFFCL